MKLIDGKQVLEGDDVIQKWDVSHWEDGITTICLDAWVGEKVQEVFNFLARVGEEKSIAYIERPTKPCKCPKYPGAIFEVEDIKNPICTKCGGRLFANEPKPCHETVHEEGTPITIDGLHRIFPAMDEYDGKIGTLEMIKPCSDPNGCRMEGVVRVKKWHF